MPPGHFVQIFWWGFRWPLCARYAWQDATWSLWTISRGKIKSPLCETSAWQDATQPLSATSSFKMTYDHFVQFPFEKMPRRRFVQLLFEDVTCLHCAFSFCKKPGTHFGATRNALAIRDPKKGYFFVANRWPPNAVTLRCPKKGQKPVTNCWLPHVGIRWPPFVHRMPCSLEKGKGRFLLWPEDALGRARIGKDPAWILLVRNRGFAVVGFCGRISIYFFCLVLLFFLLQFWIFWIMLCTLSLFALIRFFQVFQHESAKIRFLQGAITWFLSRLGWSRFAVFKWYWINTFRFKKAFR